jgi:urea transport system permease protein
LSFLFGLLDLLFNSNASVFLLASLGLAIVFGLMGVINMAHGEFMMIGAYTTVLVQNGFELLGDTWFPWYFAIAVPAAFVVTALLGVLLERGVVRFLYGRPLETLLATWGVSLILQQFVRSISWGLLAGLLIFCLLFFGGWTLLRRQLGLGFERAKTWVLLLLLPLSVGIGVYSNILLGQVYKLTATKPWFGAQNQDLTAPKWMRGGLKLGDFQLPYTRMFIMALTIACVLGVFLFLQKSRWGLRIRAVTQNRMMSACLGIPTTTVDTLTFAIGSGLAGVAGCALSLLGSVGPNVGQSYIVNTFMVVVLGGVGKLVGTIFGAIAIGILNYVFGAKLLVPLTSSIKPLSDFFDFFGDTSMATVLVFFLIVLFLQFRPAGLFPQKGRTVDA